MASRRALTSTPPSDDHRESTQQDQITSLDQGYDPQFYVPHVFDFVSIFKPADYSGGLFGVPPLYLEALAVEQSVIVGQGASFTAYKKAIQPAPIESVTSDMGDWAITTSTPQKVWPSHVIYKVARVAFTEIGTPTPQTRQAMKAALMEVYSLVHEPLRNHPNIIKLLDLAWGPNYFNPSHRLPVLVVEFADYGNLAELQEKKDLDSITKCRLAVDVGEGLKMLHRCGIIHGDVKSENILIFSDPAKEFIAKLSDFGFSMVAEAENTDVFVGGTRPWKAPETKSPVPKYFLQATDTYSYGLLLWRLAIDGADPFRLWHSSTSYGESYLQQLERIKADDEPVRNTTLDTWLIPYIYQKHADLTMDPLTRVLRNLQMVEMTTEPAQSESTVSVTSFETLINFLGPCLGIPQLWQDVSGLILQCAQQNSFYSRLPSVLDNCISADPTKRDLQKAIAALTGDNSSDASATNTAGTDNVLLHMSYNHHILSWQQMRALEPAVQSFIFKCFKAKVQNYLSKQLINPPDCFVLASYYINGYGTEVNFGEAIQLIQESSKMEYDHHSSRTYAYRIFKALDPSYVPNSDMIANLSVMAVKGARMAAADLKDVAPEEYGEVESLIRDVHAGVGADFFYDKQMLYGGTYWQWIRTFDNQHVLVEILSKWDRISEYRVNRRGDRVLHLAASAGKIDAIETLLTTFPSFSIDQHNDKGETPLLYACRAGQQKTVFRLLELGADAAITAANGESCLHWLVSFNDNEISPIGEGLIRGGAKLRVYTRDRVGYSQLRANIDVAFQIPGTPLNWAVHHNRPSIIKFILHKASDASVCLDWPTDLLGHSSPLEYAAFFHHVDCLELMIDALDSAGLGYCLSRILVAGTNAADVFSMILRNGASYQERLHSFLDLCLVKSKDTVFTTGIGGFNTHLLYYAVSEGLDEVVEYLLSSKVRELVDSFDIKCGEGQTSPGAYSASDINRPAREDHRTPLLEAVRWNRKHIVELLAANGADPKAAARNPFSTNQLNWTGLHIFAAAGHDEDHSGLVSFLIQSGLPVDGILDAADGSQLTPETPFLLALQHNAFNLATTLLDFGADPNALRTSAGFLSLEHPTTVLGHVVASSSQHTIPRLRYLLEQCPKSDTIDFIVEPARQLTALHRAAWAHKGIMYRMPHQHHGKYLPRDDYDFVMNRSIIQELLQNWGNRDIYLNCRCDIHGRTALHLAVEAGNVMGVELLLINNADPSICDDFGLTPAELSRELCNAAPDEPVKKGIYNSITELLVRE